MSSQKEAVDQTVAPSKNWIVEYFEEVQQVSYGVIYYLRKQYVGGESQR